MKINIFYSWQSDLPNNKNRGLIQNCINKAVSNVYENYKNIFEYELITDSRRYAFEGSLHSRLSDCVTL